MGSFLQAVIVKNVKEQMIKKTCRMVKNFFMAFKFFAAKLKSGRRDVKLFSHQLYYLLRELLIIETTGFTRSSVVVYCKR
jgi:hypothetical protein